MLTVLLVASLEEVSDTPATSLRTSCSELHWLAIAWEMNGLRRRINAINCSKRLQQSRRPPDVLRCLGAH